MSRLTMVSAVALAVFWPGKVALSLDCDALAGKCRSGTSTARERFNCGLEVAAERCYEGAIGIWLDVLDEVDKGDVPQVNRALGLAFKKVGRLPEAWHYLGQYMVSSDESGQRDETAEGWLTELEQELKRDHVKIAFACTPSSGEVILSSKSFPEGQTYKCALSWWFKPGKHKIEATMPGYRKWSEEIVVKKVGDSGARKVKLFKEVKPDGGTPVPDGGTVKKPEPTSRSRTLEWTLIWSGVAIAATGGALGMLANSENEDLHDQYRDKSVYPDSAVAEKLYMDEYEAGVEPKLTCSYIGYGVGGAALLGGVVLWLVRSDGAGDAGASTTLLPLLAPDSPGAVLSLQF